MADATRFKDLDEFDAWKECFLAALTGATAVTATSAGAARKAARIADAAAALVAARKPDPRAGAMRNLPNID